MELKMSNLTKKFRDMTAVRNVSYTMTAGVYGLLGINGAGKTTLMRMLCTLLKPTGGSITWDGEDIFEMDGEYRKILGYLPQGGTPGRCPAADQAPAGSGRYEESGKKEDEEIIRRDETAGRDRAGHVGRSEDLNS